MRSAYYISSRPVGGAAPPKAGIGLNTRIAAVRVLRQRHREQLVVAQYLAVVVTGEQGQGERHPDRHLQSGLTDGAETIWQLVQIFLEDGVDDLLVRLVVGEALEKGVGPYASLGPWRGFCLPPSGCE
jgi:hypothetical protein